MLSWNPPLWIMHMLYANNVRDCYSDRWVCFSLACLPCLLLSYRRKSRKSSLWIWKAIQGTWKQLLLHSNTQAAALLPSWGRFHVTGYVCFHPSSGNQGDQWLSYGKGTREWSEMHLRRKQLCLYSFLLLGKLTDFSSVIKRRLIAKIKNTQKKGWNLIFFLFFFLSFCFFFSSFSFFSVFLFTRKWTIALQVKKLSVKRLGSICPAHPTSYGQTSEGCQLLFPEKVNDHIRQGYWCAGQRPELPSRKPRLYASPWLPCHSPLFP